VSEEQIAAWQSLFPLWPKELIEKFSQSILVDFPRYGLGDLEQTGMRGWWAAVVSAESARMQVALIHHTHHTGNIFNYALFNGGPAQYQLRWFMDNVNVPYPIPAGMIVPHAVIENVSAVFDSRIWQWPVWFIPSAVCINWAYYLNNYPGERIFEIKNNLGFNAQPYDSVNTVLALYENSISNPGVDYSLMYEYRDYRNAYEKYGNQLAAQKATDEQKAKNEIIDFKNSLDDKLNAEKNQLQNLELSMRQAMTNEAASASRDMANTVLNAQNLKLSLLQALK